MNDFNAFCILLSEVIGLKCNYTVLICSNDDTHIRHLIRSRRRCTNEDKKENIDIICIPYV